MLSTHLVKWTVCGRAKSARILCEKLYRCCMFIFQLVCMRRRWGWRIRIFCKGVNKTGEAIARCSAEQFLAGEKPGNNDNDKPSVLLRLGAGDSWCYF